ncbi:MAG: Rap1a/Tai family immunity protein [Acetobacteraceae bacterium]
MRARTAILGAVFAAFVMSHHAHAAVTQDNFQLRNTADLAALCTAGPADPMAAAAVNFCDGFVIGVVRAMEKVDSAEAPRRGLFCLPANRPSRSAAIAEFVHWANADPSRLSMPAEDGLAMFLAATFPCPAGR